LPPLPVDLAAMTDLEHDNLTALIVDQIDHPVIALTDSVLVFAR
jgi:hypothetical protein